MQVLRIVIPKTEPGVLDGILGGLPALRKSLNSFVGVVDVRRHPEQTPQMLQKPSATVVTVVPDQVVRRAWKIYFVLRYHLLNPQGSLVGGSKDVALHESPVHILQGNVGSDEDSLWTEMNLSYAVDIDTCVVYTDFCCDQDTVTRDA